MRRERKIKKQRRLMIISLFIILLYLSIGYSAFSTNITVNIKGNIKDMSAAKYLKTLVVSSGNGLYKDIYHDNRYIYKGTAPNNYILLNNDLYRIISVENDNTLKVLKNTSIGTMSYDTQDNRYDPDTYCNNNAQGCKIWSSKTTTLNALGIPIEIGIREVGGTEYTLPEKEATLNTYLNNEWYQSLNEDIKNLITIHDFNEGTLNYRETIVTNSIKENEAYKWHGKVALLTAIDYISANNNNNCNTMNSNTWDANLYRTCKLTNYISTLVSTKAWLMSPFSTGEETSAVHVMYINTVGAIGSWGAWSSSTHDVFPVFFLKSNITLKGNGTLSNPYIPASA